MVRAGYRAHALNVPENVWFQFLPPCSPQLNPAENLWDDLREKGFHNPVFPSLDAVEDRLVEQLARLERDQKRVQIIAGWDWVTSLNLNANEYDTDRPCYKRPEGRNAPLSARGSAISIVSDTAGGGRHKATWYLHIRTL
ncbi:MAG: transposase [Proteobacteria bacterium]|nr:transposase [Pseudomonadota bacterium]